VRDVVIYQGLTVSQLGNLREVQLVLRYGPLYFGDQTERDALDAAIRKARDKRLLEYVVDDDFAAQTKTITLYPYLQCPPELEYRVIRREPDDRSQGASDRHRTVRRAVGDAEVGQAPRPQSSRPLLGDCDHDG
jgi:hypothetical protein